jgi:predicted component of viral defense system (DUF524 family)
MINCKEIFFKSENATIRITSSNTSSIENYNVVNYQEEFGFSLKEIDSESNLQYDPNKRCPIILFENAEYWFQFNYYEPRESDIESTNILTLRDKKNKQNFLLRFDSANYVGILNLSPYNINESLIEVESKKIDYKDEYNNLMQEISKLELDLVTRATSFFEIPVSNNETPSFEKDLLNSKLSVIRSKILSGEFENLYNSFFRKPLTRINVKTAEKFIWEVEQFDIQEYIDGYFKERITLPGGDTLPARINSEYYDDSVDNIENQFIKYLLEVILQNLTDALFKIQDIKEMRFLKYTITECIIRCENIYSNPIFKNISRLKYFPSKSNALHNKHPYKELYQFYLLLFYNLDVKDDLINKSITAPQKDLPKLYEYWCYMNIIDILSNKFQSFPDLMKDGFIKYDETQLCFNFINSENGLTFNISPNKKLILHYQKKYKASEIIFSGRSYSQELDPDISLELFTEDKLIAILHLDPKYKLDKNEGWKPEDINKMHAYKDAIMGTIGSFVLYPGDNIKNKAQYFRQEEKDINPNPIRRFPGVGAFPLNINNNSGEKNDILHLIEEFISIDAYLINNGIFNKVLKPYDYLKRLID